jgi:hypothetical protein
MKSVEYDLGYVRAGLEVLEKYLLSDDVFWPMNATPPQGEPDYPKLTLDGVLLACTRLKAYQLPFEQEGDVEMLLADLELNRTRWRVAWEKKARQCLQVRLRMWGNYLQEYKDNPLDNADRYGYEVRLRTMIELARNEYQAQQVSEGESISRLDAFLRRTLTPAGFIWEEEVQSGFPRDRYWFLYGKLPTSVGGF